MDGRWQTTACLSAGSETQKSAEQLRPNTNHHDRRPPSTKAPTALNQTQSSERITGRTPTNPVKPPKQSKKMKTAYQQVADLISRAQQMGLSVYEQQEELMIKAAKNVKIDPSILKEIKEHKEELLLFLKDAGQRESLDLKTAIPVVKRGGTERIPLSFAQERLWLVDQLNGSLQYHVSRVLKLKGVLRREVLEKVLRAIVERHEPLRTVIKTESGRPYQDFLSAEDWHLDYREGEELAELHALQQYVGKQLLRAFDLAKDFMFRGQLLKIGEDEYLLVLILHHIAADGWSLSVLVDDLIRFYEAEQAGRPLRVESSALQYADYAAWQRQHLSSAAFEEQVGWWKQQLAGVAPLNLTTDFPRKAVQSTAGGHLSFKIDKALADTLQAQCRKVGATLFMYMLGAFKVLLYRYSGQEDLCVGTPIANRNRKELEPLVGCFINSIALRSQVEGTQSFSNYLQALKEITLSAYAHQEIPFERLVKEVAVERDASRNPIFQAVFVMQNMPEAPTLNLGDLEIAAAPMGQPSSKFDLTFTITEMDWGLDVMVEYCSDLFKATTIRRMAAHYQQLLVALSTNPDLEIDRLKFIGEEEQQQVLSTFNATDKPYPSDQTIVSLFEAEVARRPTAPALSYNNQTLRYAELNRQANQLAHHLRNQYQCRPGQLVALLMDRSTELLVSILGILKSGAAYLPLQSKNPWERNLAILKEAKVELLLTTTEYMFELEGFTGELYIPEIQAAELPERFDNPPAVNQPNDLAYTMFTSGTTGLPKGTLISHQNVISLVKGIDYIQLDEDDRLLSTGAPSFDAATFEYWGMLLNGGELILCDKAELLDAEQLQQLIQQKACTKMWFTASWFNELVEHKITVFEPLQSIIIGGEKLSAPHVRKLKQHYPLLQIINGYGPTENTSFSLTHTIPPPVAENIPIGRPLNNRRAYILDKHLTPCPIGVTGELWVGGAGVGLGYLNAEALTAERFRPSPFMQGERLYRTGDLARWLPEGIVEFLGRADRQVKIRGYRLELGEVEQQLSQLEDVSQCAVEAWTAPQGIKLLVAYIVPKGAWDKGKIQIQLRKTLPDYMIPSLWVSLDTLPLTANGKLNRRALPDPDKSALLRKAYVAPSTETEQKLVAIWQELLQVEKVGIKDNFFELGGHSLLATRLVSAIQETFELEISIVKIFQLLTIAPLASYLDVLSTPEAGEDQQEFDLDDL
ncbi:MAG: amino acid adenylation domain-containing protein [Bacteroidota bacterium]